MRRGALALLIALVLAGCGERAEDRCPLYAAPAADLPPANGPATADQAYVDAVAAADLYESEAARLALERAMDGEVRMLARMILTDHRRSTDLLTSAAGEAVPPFAVAPRLTPAQNRDLAALCAVQGDAFDAEYLRQQLAAHERALALVAGYTLDGRVASLRAHAAWVPATLGRHIERTRQLIAARED